MKSKFISVKDFINAEKLSFEADIPMKKAINPHGGEIEIINRRKVIKLVKKRSPNSHKGSFGRLVCVVGSDRFMGAAQISTLAAFRSGVGLLEVVTTENAAIALSNAIKEATLLPIESGDDGFIASSELALHKIEESIKKADAVLIGCGLGNTPNTLKILEKIIETANCPIIIDADGINALSNSIELLRKAKTDVILTPHPAELARLVNADISEVLANRYYFSKRISDEYGVTVVAKSASTLIISKDSDYLSVFGNDGLAKGGSGDLLAGLISSFVAQGYSASEASMLGVAILGLSCEMVSKKLSRTSMLASDILDCLPLVFRKIERLR